MTKNNVTKIKGNNGTAIVSITGDVVVTPLIRITAAKGKTLVKNGIKKTTVDVLTEEEALLWSEIDIESEETE